MLLPVFRSAALTAALALTSLAAPAQTFGEFLNKPELPVTFLGADYSAVRYYGDPMTVSQDEMKTQFTKINELLVHEARKYDIQGALRRTAPVTYAIDVAEAANKSIDSKTLIVPSDAAHRTPLTAQAIADLVRRYALPAGSKGVGLVFIGETIDKNTEEEVFWLTFVDLASKKVLYTERVSEKAQGFGFRNHWAAPLYQGIKGMKQDYGKWQKEFAKK